MHYRFWGLLDSCLAAYETYYAVVDIDGRLHSARIVADIVKDEARGRGYYYHQISGLHLGDPVGKSRSQSDESQTNYPGSPRSEISLGQLTGKSNNNASKVVDENGEPMVVYHGTGADFSVFDKSKIGRNFDDPNGYFFTNSTGYDISSTEHYEGRISAGAYARNANGNGNGNGNANIMPVFINLRNPSIVREGADGAGVLSLIESRSKGAGHFLDEEIAYGHDGVIAIDLGSNNLSNNLDTIVIASEANQIKSATGNNGAFSTINDGTKFSIATKQKTPQWLKWFGHSKMNRGGEPIKFYHGSQDQFTVYDKGRLASNTTHTTAGLGHFFTEDKGEAQQYGGNVHEVYLSVQKPLEFKHD